MDFNGLLKASPARPPRSGEQLAGGGDAAAAGQMTTTLSARSGLNAAAPALCRTEIADNGAIIAVL